MIATPTKTDSSKYSISNNKINYEISENKSISDYIDSNLLNKNYMDNKNIIDNSKNYSEIHAAIISDNLEELEKLLKLGEDPDILNKSGETPLYLCVDIENYNAMIILLEFGADCNIQKYDGNTPLHLATEKKNELFICALLSNGANPNIINKTNLQTSLHIAIINKINEYILNKFKENNGDIYNIKDKFNKTPFDYAQNDEKYTNLLISIFSEQNKGDNNNNKKECLTENKQNNSNLDYNNFISLSRNIHINDEDIELNKNNNVNQNNEDDKFKNINNCLKKHLIFSSNSKDISSENKSKKIIINSNISSKEQNDKSSQGSINKNIINILSDKSSNYSNFTNNNIINNSNHINNAYNEKLFNITEIDKDLFTKIYLTSIKKGKTKINDQTNINYNLFSPISPIENKSFSHSFNLGSKISSIKSNNSNNIKSNNIKNIKKFNTNTNNSITNENKSINSFNKRKEEGISELNPLDMINQIASSNNSNIFSELQINSNTNNKEEKDIENTDIKNMKTEEEFYNVEENNKITSNDELNNIKENISGNFSSNNNIDNDNDNYNDNDNEIYTSIKSNNYNDEDENKENINFNNSLDDSLEYSKSKSYINETPLVLTKDKNNNNNSEKNIINNKEESFNIYNSNLEKTNNHNTNKNIERYKSTTSNKSKIDYDIDSEHFSYDKSSNISNISSLLVNKINNHHHRQLSYHNNKQSSSNKNKYKNNNINNNAYVTSYNTSTNKENIDPNKDNDIIINKSKTEIIDKNEIDINETNNNYQDNLKIIESNEKNLPVYTMVSRQRVYKTKNLSPNMAKQQKTNDVSVENYRPKENSNQNDENILFINDTTNNNYNDGNTINTAFLDYSNHNQYNTFYSDNMSYKNYSKDSHNYSLLFRKALKKKFLIKEFSQNNKDNTINNISKEENENENENDEDKNNNNNNNNNDIIHPQQISNELITKLRDWLISCDLLCYYNLLIKNNIYDIEAYITNLKNNKINISYKDIEDLGIKKPGHIFRFLLKLQIDIGVLDNKICSYIMNKFNENLCTTLGVNVSMNEISYCGIILCPSGGDLSRSSNYTDIFSFLKNKDLLEFKENFVHNGFDQIEFVLIQLFSCFSFNKEILNDYMHIYSDNDKNQVIKKLYEEKRIISRELGIKYDEKEVYTILNEQFDEVDNVKISNDNICNIF